MAKFKDSKGREYDVVFHVGTLRRIRGDAGFDPLDLLSPDEAKQSDARDPERIALTLWYMVEASAKAHGVILDEFLSLLVGDTLNDATNAMIDALIGFSPSPRTRELMRKAWANGKALEEMGLKAAEELMTKTNSALSASLSTASSSPASSESTQTG